MADTTIGKQVYQYFIDKGLPPHQAAAIAGNMQWESGGNVGGISPGDNWKNSPSSPHSFGLAQWNDRLPGLINYAREQGRDVPAGNLRDVGYVKSIAPQLDVPTQLGYAWQEMQGPERRSFEAIQAAPDLRSATAAAIGYHRPAGWTRGNPEGGHGFEQRLGLAQQIAGGEGSGDMATATSGQRFPQLWAALKGRRLEPGQAATVEAPQQQSAAPVQQLPDEPSAVQKRLAEAMTERGRQSLAAARSPWEVAGGLAQQLVGQWQSGRAEEQQTARQKALASALAGASDANSIMSTLLGSGDPELMKTGLSMRLQSMKGGDPRALAELEKTQAETAKLRAETTGAGGKAPEGYRVKMSNGQPVTDETGRPIVEPIPGGPKESLGAEVGARLGMTKSFLTDYPGIRREIEGGGLSDVTGGIVSGMLGIGQPGDLQLRIKTGADALLRNLTGAGMPNEEAARYVQRYEPTMTDSRERVMQKLDRLAREIYSSAETVTAGHGQPQTYGLTRPEAAFAARSGAESPAGGQGPWRRYGVGEPAAAPRQPGGDVEALRGYLGAPTPAAQADARLEQLLQPSRADVGALLSRANDPRAIREFEARFGLQPGTGAQMLQEYARR